MNHPADDDSGTRQHALGTAQRPWPFAFLSARPFQSLLRGIGVLLALGSAALFLLALLFAFDGLTSIAAGTEGRYKLGHLFAQGGLGLAAFAGGTFIFSVALATWKRLPSPLVLLAVGLWVGGIGGIVWAIL